MRITRLELKNGGVFDNQVIEFQPKTDPDNAEIHILTGINGSGKSTILYALASAFFIVPQFLQRRFRYPDARSQVEITCSNSSGQLYLQSVGYDKNSNFFYVKDEQRFYQYRVIINEPWQTVQNREFEFATFAYSGSRTLSSVDITAIQELATNPLQDALNFQGSVDPKLLIQ